MKNDKWQFVVGTSDFYLSLVIGHWSFVICHLVAGYPVILSKQILLSCPHDAPNESGGRPDSADVSGAPDSGRRGSRVCVAGIRRHGFSQAGSGGPALS